MAQPVVELARQTALQAVFDGLTVGIGIGLEDGRFIEVNNALLTLLGVDREAALGRTLTELVQTDLALVRGGDERREQSLTRPDGSQLWVRIARSDVLARDGQTLLTAWSVEEITALKQAQAALRERALLDPVTGLANRHLLQDRLAHSLAQREKARLAIVFVDLDAFKHVNDTAGHRVGDEVLRQAGARIVTCARVGDTVGRWAGDEFVVLCEGISDVADAQQIAARITAACAQPFVAGGMTFLLGASVGLALTGGDHGDDPNAALDRADRAMYADKSARQADRRP